jgi:hypothetical protein
MAVRVTQEFEGDTAQYDQVNEKLDPQNNPPEGLIVHSAADAGGGKMRIVDVWESQGAYESFAQDRLGPVIAEVVGEDAPPPDTTFEELHAVVKP